MAASAAGEAYQGPPKISIVPGTAREVGGQADVIPVLVEVQPAWGVKRMPCDICIVIDISGSMSGEATIQSGPSTGLTLLDIAKHGVRTVASTLGEEDRLSLVWFNHMAGQALPLTKMDEAGRKAAGDQLDAIEAGGGTNIWLGLEQGMNSLKADTGGNRMAHVMLLTDGQTTNRGTVMQNLQEYRQKHEALPGTLSTFGFGYNIDSPLLVDISNFGDATYSFIPDAGFVGTCFVNTLSNLLCSFGKEAFLSCEVTDCEIVGVLGGYPMEKTSEGARIKVGTLQYQQPRSVVLLVKAAGGDPQLGSNLSYQTETKATMDAEFVEVSLKERAADAERRMVPQFLRSRFIDTLSQISATLGANVSEQSLKDAKDLMDGCSAEMKAATEVAEDPFVKTLVEDASGQSTEAVTRADWWRKWGCHYMPSLVFAHRTQQCNNFKDPGVQAYGGGLFLEVQAAADAKFNELPAPTPSARSFRSSGPVAAAAAAPASMSSYNDRYGR